MFGHQSRQSVSSSDDNSEPHKRTKRQDPGIGDESQNTYEVKSSRLPMMPGGKTVNDRYMPTLGNGHLATTAFGDGIYMNGFYSGVGADSHRAKIPAMIMGRVRLADDEMDNRAYRKYIFNAEEGVFMETIDCDFAYIEHRMYMHQKYIRLFVSDIYAVKKRDSHGGGLLKILYPDLNVSKSINFGEKMRYNSNWQVKGKTKSAEAGQSTQTVHVFWMERLRQISLRSSNKYFNETMVMAIDRQEASARAEFEAALEIIADSSRASHYELLRRHTEAWKAVWAQGLIEIDGNLQVSKITRFAQFYLLSSLPALMPKQGAQHNEIFHGVGRGSLAKGSKGRDYRGHIFWDNEMYMLPAVVLFHPTLAKVMLRYRASVADAAERHAAAMGAKGYRFPWESATSGDDVTPDTCTTCSQQQLHVTAGVGWGIRQYYSATRDHDYITNPDYRACDMMREIARFWASVSVYNTSKARYDINHVMGPDDWHPKVNNNAYTNAAASLSIHFARYLACMCDRIERDEVPDDWIHKALYLSLPYDNVKRLHFQHEGFEHDKNNTVKQADTIMLTYPLNWNMSRDIMRNDLEYYELLTTPHTPAMTWSFFTVGWKWVDDEAKTNAYFLKSYQDYIIQPFKVWTEYNERTLKDQQEGSVNYLPGMAAYLQSLIYGFGGVRIRPQMLEFFNPTPPPGCSRMRFIGFDYLQTNMTIVIEKKKVTITILNVGLYPLVLKRNSSKSVEQLTKGAIITINDPKAGFYMYTTTGSPCEHPRDYIYMPWGYSPFISLAPSFQSPSWPLLVTITVAIFIGCIR